MSLGQRGLLSKKGMKNTRFKKVNVQEMTHGKSAYNIERMATLEPTVVGFNTLAKQPPANVKDLVQFGYMRRSLEHRATKNQDLAKCINLKEYNQVDKIHQNIRNI